MAWSTAGLLAAVALPWYALQEGLDSGAWLTGLWSSEDYASGLAQFVEHNRWWLAPVLVALAACLVTCLIPVSRERRGTWLVISSATGVVLFIAQGLTVGLHGWSADWLTAAFGELDGRQIGIGAGATLALIALLALLSIGLALRGAFGGDAFVAGAITTVGASILLFTAWPTLRILVQAFQDGDGVFRPVLLLERLS
ncbi:MAG: iron(III) transport system permease protein, partial [Rhodospirillaceae bacterium]|nr:iron(III) transport system permease protein [Rhodospirillaceae bacterium]